MRNVRGAGLGQRTEVQSTLNYESAFEEQGERETNMSDKCFSIVMTCVGIMAGPAVIWLILYWLYLAGYFHAPCPMYEGRECNAPYGRCMSTGFCECVNPLFSGERCEATTPT